MALARAKVWEKLCWELLSVRVEPGHVISIVENQQAFGVVQVDTHFLQLTFDIETGPGLSAGAVLVAVMHNDAVEATAGLDLDAPLTIDGLIGYANHPLSLF